MVTARHVPEHALHKRYRDEGGHVDCYSVDINASVDLAKFVEAFYTCWLFKIERVILKWVVSKPSTDEQARALAQGTINRFAAWSEEARTGNQLLMRDYQGRTLSWFMVDGDNPTRLYFGSAIVAARNRRSDAAERISIIFRATLWFHKIYSRALLRAAVGNLKG